MAAMLHSSDDDAADTLWSRYSGADHQAFNADFPAYGLTGLQPQCGFSRTFPYWGFQKATPEDLDRLINYTLSDLPAAETATLPRSTKTPNTSALGPAKKRVPRTAIRP